MADQVGGPAQVVLTASVARRYYLDGRSKVEIAEEFGLRVRALSSQSPVRAHTA